MLRTLRYVYHNVAVLEGEVQASHPEEAAAKWIKTHLSNEELIKLGCKLPLKTTSLMTEIVIAWLNGEDEAQSIKDQPAWIKFRKGTLDFKFVVASGFKGICYA